MSAQTQNPGRFDEGAPIEDPATAAAKERAALSAAIASETDTSASGRDRVGVGSGGSGAVPGSGVGGASGAGPAFDRLAAERRIADTPYPQMTKTDGAGATTCIFSAEDLEILAVDMGKLKAKSTKAKDREATCKKLGAVDVIDLQKRKDVLTDRAHAWRKRALEKAEDDFKAGKQMQAAASVDERRKAFRKLIAGARPYHAWNKGAALLASDEVLGAPAKHLAFDKDEIEGLSTLTDAAIDEHLDYLFEMFGVATPTTVAIVAVGGIVAMKAFACYSAWQEAKVKRARPRADPSLN